VSIDFASQAIEAPTVGATLARSERLDYVGPKRAYDGSALEYMVLGRECMIVGPEYLVLAPEHLIPSRETLILGPEHLLPARDDLMSGASR
jgi:hypothetical protein